MEIIDNKALLLRLKNPDPVLATIPNSKLVEKEEGISKVLVKWGLEEAQVLASLRIKNVPSTIKNEYAWTGFHKPMEHQIETASFRLS